ncbi:MAG: pseudouridine synthase, partial [Chloroflexota bacterium]
MGERLSDGTEEQPSQPTVLMVPPGDAGQRLDRWLAAQLGDLSRAHLQHAIAQGQVLLAGRSARASARLEAGQRVQLQLPGPRLTTLAAEPIPLNVVYEDADLLVIDKQPGLVVHPAPGHPSGTLVNALLARWHTFKGLKGDLRPGIVHRLDKDTSGLIIVAKNDLAMLKLAQQIKNRAVQKQYLALVQGRLEPPQGRVEAPVGRHPADRLRMAVVTGGRAATTH